MGRPGYEASCALFSGGKVRVVLCCAAKTTGKKQTTAAVRTARTGQRQATQRKTRRRGVRFEQDESSEESDEK